MEYEEIFVIAKKNLEPMPSNSAVAYTVPTTNRFGVLQATSKDDDTEANNQVIRENKKVVLKADEKEMNWKPKELKSRDAENKMGRTSTLPHTL